jgi:hypothetical protein
MASPSPDLVLLLLLVTSFSAEPYPLALVPQRCSPSSSTAHRLGPTVESHDSGSWPLPYGAMKWVNRHSSRLPHILFRFGGVSESEGLASLEGSASGGGTSRDGVGEVGGVVSSCGASGPWGRPHGPMEIRVVRHITSAPTGPMTTLMSRASSSSSPPPPPPPSDDPMTMACASVQPDRDLPQLWTAHGRPRRPYGEVSGFKGSIGRYADRLREGDGVVLTCEGVAWLKAVVVVEAGTGRWWHRPPR